MDLIRAFSDPDAWGAIKDNVPIFRAHKWWERKVGERTECRTTLPGEADLDASEGWSMAYEVKEDDLEEVCREVNKMLDEGAKPIKLLIGHSKPGRPQEEQPALAGYGYRAKMGTFGPNKVPAVVTKAFYRKGYEEAAAEYPERSPEFKQSTRAITGVALLKTDPRLPMGFVAYGDERFYGEGFMPDKEDSKDEKKVDETAAKDDAVSPPAPAAPVPAAAPAAAPAAPAPLAGGELIFADRLWNHYMASKPCLGHLEKQYSEFTAAQAPMAAASPTNGRNPATPIGAEASTDKPAAPAAKPDEAHMMDEEEKRQYEENQAFLMQENARLYADSQYDQMIRLGVKKSLLGKFKEKIVKLRMDAKTNTEREAACKDYLDEVKNNYARESRPPTGRDFLPIPSPEQPESTEGGAAHDLDLQDAETVTAITRYAEVHKIDILNDEDGWNAAVEAFAASKKKKPVAKTA
jgi:hypothetical protein